MENGHEPATKADVGAVESRLEKRLTEVEERLIETIRDSQTEVLTAFYSFAESNQRRLTESEHETASLKERMALFEKRLMDLERKVNFPHYPAQ